MANTSGKQNYGELCFLHICAYNSQFITFYIFWWSQQGVKDFLSTAIMRNKTNTKHHCVLIIIIITVNNHEHFNCSSRPIYVFRFCDDVPFSAQLQSESQQSHHQNPHYQHHQEPEIMADILLKQ